MCKYLLDLMKICWLGVVLNVGGFIGDIFDVCVLLVGKGGGGVFFFEFLVLWNFLYLFL